VGYGLGSSYYQSSYCYPQVYSYSYYTPSVCYSSCYVDPCSLSSAPALSTIPSMSPAVTLKINPAPSVTDSVIQSSPSGQTLPPSSTLPAPGAQPDAGTFPYDGGPKDPIPMPRAEEIPTTARTYDMVIRPAQFVSIPETTSPASKTGKWKFPAYGEEAKRSSSR